MPVDNRPMTNPKWLSDYPLTQAIRTQKQLIAVGYFNLMWNCSFQQFRIYSNQLEIWFGKKPEYHL